MTDPELDALVKRLENVSLQVGFPSRTILDSAVIRQAIDTITTLRAQLAEAQAEVRVTLACNRGLVRLNEATESRADRAEAALATQVTVKPDPVREITIRLNTAEVCALLDKAEADLQHLNTIAATIRVNTLRHGGTHEQADAFIKGEADFVAWMVAKVQPTVSPDVAAQIEADAGIADDYTPEKHSGMTLQAHVTGRNIAAAIRNQPHDRTALDRIRRAERDKALLEAADIAAHYTDKITAEDIANAILAMIEPEDN